MDVYAALYLIATIALPHSIVPLLRLLFSPGADDGVRLGVLLVWAAIATPIMATWHPLTITGLLGLASAIVALHRAYTILRRH